MAIKLGTSRQTVTRLMNDCQISYRSVAEDTRLRYKNMSDKDKKKYTKNAIQANTGRKTPLIERAKRARSLEIICKLSPNEQSFDKFLLEYSFCSIPQYAIAIFNIDFAFPKQKIAIELDVGNWHQTTIHQKCQKRKENYLTKQGWIVLRINFSKGKWNPSKSSFIKSLSELLSSRTSTHPL